MELAVDAALIESPQASTVVAGVDLRALDAQALVERARLREQLEASASSVVLLQAPAGYGKSVLLAQWASTDQRPFASVTLSALHDDPGALLSSIAEALHPIEPLAEEIVLALQAPEPNLAVVLDRLERTLPERELPVVLVLDELEHVSSEGSMAILATFAKGLPHGSQLALATRAAKLPHAGRLRASRKLTELGPEHLAMTSGESRDLLAGIGLEASEADLESLVARTEGWAAALYLAGISLRGERDLSAAIAEFAGDERFVVDYMREELLRKAPPQWIEFLTGVSVLDRLSGPLCDAVLEREGSAAMLSELSRQNILLIPLDRRDEWFRMHSLLAGMLQAELAREGPERARELHRRASTWWAERGDSARAITHAIAAADHARAGELLWAAIHEYNARGKSASLRRWLEEIGPEAIIANPHLSLTYANVHLAVGEGATAEHWGEVTRGLIGAAPPQDRTLLAGLATLDATLARAGVEAMAAQASEGSGLFPSDNPWQVMGNMLSGIAAHLLGERERAREQLSEGARGSALWEAPLIQVINLAQLALLSAEEGDIAAGRILASQARAQVDRTGLGEYPTMAVVFAASAYVRVGESRPEEARADLRAGLALLERVDGMGGWFEIEVRAALAATAIGLGDLPLATRLQGEAASLSAEYEGGPVLAEWVASIGAEIGRIADSGAGDLTPAELRVLRLLPTHLSFPQIAAELFVSPNTVKTQAKAAYRKLGVSSRAEAVARGREAGLIAAEPE